MRGALLPPHAPGLRVGLYGGSFNPPHAGHRHVSLLALKRLALDRVWWLVTPGNPLKGRDGLAATAQRLEAAGRMARHPRIAVTGIEESLGTRYTVDTLAAIVSRRPDLCFVWIMGADNLASFDRWRGWRAIAALVPFAVVDRPGWTLKAARSRAAVALAPWRIDETDAPLLADLDAPAWTFLHGPRSALSSTLIRSRRELAADRDIEIREASALS